MKGVSRESEKTDGKHKKRKGNKGNSDQRNQSSDSEPDTGSGGARKDQKLTRSEIGFEVAARELNLPEEFLSRVPSDVRDWRADHAQLWLQEVFHGADTLQEYVFIFSLHFV